jgi:hypothetical protein
MTMDPQPRPSPADRLRGLLESIEETLAAFYGFDLQARAADHLISTDELITVLARVARSAHPIGRAGVWLIPEADQTLFIGINIAGSIADTLERDDPTALLSDTNLDAFCVVIEEVSHFHLLLGRAARGLGASKLELEWQGEIDKLLVCGAVLQRQQGRPHLAALARRLYDHALCHHDDTDLYWQATKHAARFWQEAISLGAGWESPLASPELQKILRRLYTASWTDKLHAISELTSEKILPEAG